MPEVPLETKTSHKKKWTVLILCVLLGWFGIHRFYLGKYLSGGIYLVTFGLFGIGVIFDIVIIIIDKMTDGNGFPLAHALPNFVSKQISNGVISPKTWKQLTVIFFIMFLLEAFFEELINNILGIPRTALVSIILAFISIYISTVILYKKYGNLKPKIIFAIILSVISIVSILSHPQHTNNETAVNKTVVAPTKKIDKITSQIKQVTGVNEDNAETIKNILSNCGITDVKSIVHDVDALDNNYDNGEKGYRIQNGNTKNIILYVLPDESVYRIRYADRDLYVDGATHLTLDRFVLTLDEKGQYVVYTQNMVQNLLKAPSTAKFPSDYDEYRIIKTPDNVIVEGYVDAQNSFGAMIRSRYQAIYHENTTKIDSFVFEGKKII